MDNRKNYDEIEIDLLEICHVLLSRVWLILSAAVLCALIGFALSAFVVTPTYESTTKIYILNKTESTAVTYSDMQMGTQLTKDYAELINSRYVLEEVIHRLELDTEYDEFLEQVAVVTPADTRIVEITVTDTDPAQAMAIGNCIREVASEHIQTVMDIEAVNVVETANMPTDKAAPSVFMWTAIGGMLGFVLLCAIVLVKYLMDDTIKSSEDVEKYLELSTLALIPIRSDSTDTKSKKKKKKKK